MGPHLMDEVLAMADVAPAPGLLQLPTACLELVLARLEPRDLVAAWRTCTELQRLAGQPRLWDPHVPASRDALLSAAKHCLASVLQLPPRVFSAAFRPTASEHFPVRIQVNSAAGLRVPHACALLCKNDVEGVALDAAAAFQERIVHTARRRRAGWDAPLQPWDLFVTARADRGAVRLALHPTNALLVLRRELARLDWPARLKPPVGWLVRKAPASTDTGAHSGRDVTQGTSDSGLSPSQQALGINYHLQQRMEGPISDQAAEDAATLAQILNMELQWRMRGGPEEVLEVVCLREALHASLARLQRLLPPAQQAAQRFSWAELDGDSLAHAATRADLRLALGLNTCLKDMWWIPAEAGGQGGRAHDCARQVIGALADSLRSHMRATSALLRQELLPLVRQTAQTDVERLADRLCLAAAQAHAGEAAAACITRELKALRASAEGCQQLLRFLLQLEWLKLCDLCLAHLAPSC